MIFWKVGYPNVFSGNMFSGGKQTIHKVSAAFIVQNCHPRTSLTAAILEKVEQIWLKFPMTKYVVPCTKILCIGLFIIGFAAAIIHQ